MNNNAACSGLVISQYLSSGVSFPDNVVILKEDHRFDGQCQQSTEPQLSVVKQRHLEQVGKGKFSHSY